LMGSEGKWDDIGQSKMYIFWNITLETGLLTGGELADILKVERKRVSCWIEQHE
jgi:hypothetical protein